MMLVIHSVKKAVCACLCLLSPVCAPAQQTDSVTRRELSGVEVVEKRRPSVAREATPIQRMDREGIERLGIDGLHEAVQRFSGVTVKDYGGMGGLKTVSVRNLGSQHTAVDYDGVTVTNAQSGQVDIGRFTLDNVEALALSAGQTDDIFLPARRYASAGALSIRTVTPRFDTKRYRLQGQVKAGSFGMLQPVVRCEVQPAANCALSLDADWLWADGRYPYTFTNGDLVTKEKRTNSDIRSSRAEVNLFAGHKDGGNLSVKGHWFDSGRGLPGSVILYNDYHRERLQDKNGFLQAAYERRANPLWAWKTQAKFDYSRTRYRDFHSKYADGQQTDVYSQREYYASGAGLFTPFRGVSFSLAGDVFVNTLDATTPRCVFPERYTSLTALAAQYRDSRLTATASALGTYITEDVRVGDAAADRKRISPAISISYRIFSGQNLRVRASYKDIFRVPTFSDLYYERLGNRQLSSEKATQYNAGVTWSGDCLPLRLAYVSLTADAYYNRVKDKIVALPTMFIWRMMNMGQVEIRGLDVTLCARFVLPAGVFLQIDGAYTRQEVVDVTDREAKTYRHQLPYTPGHSGSVSVSVETPWVHVAWLATGVGERYSLPQNIAANRMGGYVEQQLSFSRTFSFAGSALRLQAAVVNLGDVTYDVIRYYPMPGRSFRGSIRYVF